MRRGEESGATNVISGYVRKELSWHYARHTHVGKGHQGSEDQVDFGNGAFKRVYTFNSRFEDGKGTNPEELLGAAHASCFAIVLGGAGSKPDYVDATP
jgi:organic hydroperoxide reductase OsmC/OhrA